MANMQPQPFNETYRCFPVAMKNAALEEGDKILLPSTALDHLARLKVSYPMMFEVQNKQTGSVTHCGVLEFSAEEGVAYLPYWMMQNLLCEDGGFVQIRNVTLPKGTFVQLQPHETKFTELSNPRVVLETALRKYSCLTKGETILVTFDKHKFYLDVVEVKPGNAISIIETDMNVDFAPPKDIKEWEAKKVAERELAEAVRETKDEGMGSLNLGDSAHPNIESLERKSSGGSSYFSKLGEGNRLSSGKKKSNASPGQSPTAGPGAASTSAPAGSPQRPTTPCVTQSPDGTTLTTVTKGKFDYIYSGEGVNKKLVKRLPTSARGSSASFSAFAGKGHSLKG